PWWRKTGRYAYTNYQDLEKKGFEVYNQSKHDSACDNCVGHREFIICDIRVGMMFVVDFLQHHDEKGKLEWVATKVERMDGRNIMVWKGCTGSSGQFRWVPPYHRDLVNSRDRAPEMRWAVGEKREPFNFAKAEQMRSDSGANYSRQGPNQGPNYSRQVQGPNQGGDTYGDDQIGDTYGSDHQNEDYDSGSKGDSCPNAK
ncbi:MAG: hypothetical protein GY755_10465, partial [Chloroflexi bacterium]|nr:hypothetical protein [Chloroflexota bacterium]